jgi:cellulose biosynthesis protein BcsQ
MLKQVLQQLKEMYRNAPPVVKLLIWLGLFALAAVAVTLLPQFRELARTYLSTDPTGQAAFLLFFSLYVLYSLYNLIEYNTKSEKYKQERDEARRELEVQKQEKEDYQQQLTQIEERLAKLAESEEPIWARPFTGAIPFRPKTQRRAKFVSMLNLKGGVGKTTLTANLAACLHLMNPNYKVLIVDLDFQGTLSSYCVAEDWLKAQWDNENTATQLLNPDLDSERMKRLLTSIKNLDGVQIIVANDTLEYADFQAQSRFFVHQNEEVRFQYLKLHEMPEIYYTYDLILFDCPPRITTSSVNAITCSDYILIPTKLDDNSILAMPRTFRWINKWLVRISEAKLLGVVANETHLFNKQLIKVHKSSYDHLSRMVLSQFPGVELFKNTVRHIGAAVHNEPGMVGCLNDSVREVIEPVAAELLGRLNQ